MFSSAYDHLPEAVLRAAGHWDSQHRRGPTPEDADDQRANMTIAVSREEGAPGAEVAAEIGRRLEWPVFDHELLERIAAEMDVRVELLESVDERHQSWLLESIEALAPGKTVSETSYLRHLVETLFSLAAHGGCVVVGRGAAQVLPAVSTLRVRVIAPQHDRIQRVAQEQELPWRDAERYMAVRDRQRATFTKEHFHKDPTDPQHYDLLLNSGRLSVAACATLVVEALHLRQTAYSSAKQPPKLRVAAAT